jgi:hypothetical protein
MSEESNKENSLNDLTRNSRILQLEEQVRDLQHQRELQQRDTVILLLTEKLGVKERERVNREENEQLKLQLALLQEKNSSQLQSIRSTNSSILSATSSHEVEHHSSHISVPSASKEDLKKRLSEQRWLKRDEAIAWIKVSILLVACLHVDLFVQLNL